jgi:uncharacterized protein YkwD
MRHRVAALLAGLTLVACPALSSARGEFVDTLNEVRQRGCDGRRGVATALRAQRRLDDAARRLIRGGTLAQAIKAADYRAMHSSSLHLTNAGNDVQAARALAKRSCSQVVNPEIREVGVARRGKDIWIILAAPFSAPELENVSAVRQRVLTLANQARARARRCGSKQFAAVPPLRSSQLLDQAALAHSRDMAGRNRLAHEGRDGSTPAQRVSRTQYRWRVVGENVASGPRTADEVMEGWLASPHHCENLMDARFTELGVGFVFDPDSESGVYWTQVFALPRP